MKRIFTILTIVLCIGVFGMKAQTVILSEGFSSASGKTPPSGWQNIQYYTTAAATDSWSFNNPGTRSVGAGFAGQFAIFDSEDYSNNAALEDIALESPFFSTIGHDSVFISFDYAASPPTGNAATIFVEVFSNGVWKEAHSYISPDTMWAKDTFDISSLIRNNCESRIRFRYYCQSGGWFAVDNVKVYSPKLPVNFNVQMEEVISPIALDCPNPNARLSVRVKNAGLNTVSNIPFYASVFDGASTNNYSFTWNGSIASCKDTVILFPDTLSIAYDSAFQFIIFADLSNDEVRFNSDTIKLIGFKNIPLPFVLEDLDSVYCMPYFFEDSLPLASNQTAKWYNSMSDSLPLHSGHKITLGNYTNDTTFFVETGFAQSFAVPTNSTAAVAGGASWTGNLPVGLFIDITAKKDILLDSLEVKVRTAGMMNYEVWIAKGPYVNEIGSIANWTRAHLDSTSVTTGVRNKIYVGGIRIKAGETLALNFYCSDNSAPEFYSGVPHIYENAQIKTFSSLVSSAGPVMGGTRLTGFGYNANFYYRVECDGMFSKRIYRAPVGPPVTSVIEGSVFEGYKQSNRDVVIPGKTLSYELTPPVGHSNDDYGTTWEVPTLDIISSNGVAVPAAHYIISNYPPSGSNNLSISFTPQSSWLDSTVTISASVNFIHPFCDTIVERKIFIAPNPVLDLSYSSACERKAINFLNTSSVSSGSLTYKWYFGNGDSAVSQNPSPILDIGTYNVTLLATSNHGVVADTTFVIQVLETPVVDFTATTSVCAMDSIFTTNNSSFSSGNSTYLWQFGNGNTSVLSTPVTNYVNGGDYTITLRVTGNNGCFDTAFQQVTIHARPIAGFQMSEDSVCLGAFVNFQNQSTINSGTFFSNWDFGGQGTSNNANPQYQFNNPGNYNVRLITFNSFNCSDTSSQNIIVFDAPVADFTMIGDCSNKAIKFINQSNVPLSSNPTYTWDFNFEAQSNTESPDYVFATSGSKAIYLNITLDNGCESSIAKSIAVKPSAKTSFSAENGCSEEPVIFTNTTSSLPLISFVWDLGDGTSSTDINTVNTYQTLTRQVYTITLISKVNGICPDTATQQIIIGEKAICNFEILNDYLPGHRTYKFLPERTDYLTYEWTFGDGQISAANTPIHQYTSDGNYSVTLNATTTDLCECTKTVTKTVENLRVNQLNDGSLISVYPNPTSNILNIDYQTVSTLNQLQIVDVTGKHIRYIEVSPNTQKGTLNVNVSELSAGVYFLRTQTETGTYVTKFVVSK